MKTALVVDANSVIARAVYASALDDLQAGGVFTGGIYGSLTSLRSIIDHPLIRPDRVVAFFDHGVPARRRRLLPGYKSARKERRSMLDEEQREKAMAQIPVCYRMWKHLGVQCFAFRDREADDGVAAAVRVLRDRYACVVVSSDRDLWQTIAWGASVWDQGKNILIDQDSFEEHSGGVPLDVWLLFRALVGDSSDSIPGVRSCGPAKAKTLIQLIQDDLPEDPHDQLRALCAEVRDLHRTRKPKVVETNLLEAEDYLHDVIDGIDLFRSFGPLKRLRDQMKAPRELRHREFLRECKRLQFRSVLGDPEATLGPFRRVLTG